MTQDEAREQLRRLVAADTFPTLDGFELLDLLRAARRPDYRGVLDADVPDPTGLPRLAADGAWAIWTKATDYAVDDAVVPITRNGKVYRVKTAGTSGDTEPAWPLDDSDLTDGSVVWASILGVVVWFPTYDIYSAAAEGWRFKAGKVADRITFASQGDSFNGEQVYQHCLEMAKYYDSKAGPQSIQVQTARTAPWYNIPRAN